MIFIPVTCRALSDTTQYLQQLRVLGAVAGDREDFCDYMIQLSMMT